MRVLEVKNLNKSIKNQVILDNISFNVESNSITALIGENGAGKTTTIKCIVGLYTYNFGDIIISGVNSKNIDSHYKFGYIPEKENFPNTPANIFLSESAKLYGISSNEIDEKIKYYSNLFGITEKMDLRLTKMSSGQRKKIMVMQAFFHEADLYIMDEPTENLDPQNRQIFYDELLKLKEQGKSILVSTHNLDEIAKYVDNVVIIGNGKVTYTGQVNKNHDLAGMYYEFKKSGNVNVFHSSHSNDQSNELLKRYDDLLQKKLITRDEYKSLVKNFAKE
ncbi:MAG: ABC transporter ATP-binding protein [Mycoplasmataceae bacterium]|jgi:ABC-2 type transport system ATP-binding protein|nr:ABC transporter ATP-binding protein [Mycoplasmataceae bacterium]